MSEPIRADVAVIGAGIAGLVAAALLVQRGYQVVVAERDIHPGGCAAGFSQDGYRFAVGATVAMGFEPGGVVRAVYDQLGLDPHYVNVSPAIRVHLPDRRVAVMTTHQAWDAELGRAFPGQLAAKRAFWSEVRALAAALHYVSRRFPVMPFKHLSDLLDTARGVHPGLLRVLVNLRRTVAERLAHYGIEDEAHRAFVDGQLLDAMQVTADSCAAPNGALALDIYRYGCQYKIGGLERMAHDLAGYLEARGGQVRYASRVKKILQDGRRVVGLATNRGEIHAPVVISAIPIGNTAELLEHPQLSELPQRATGFKMWGAFMLYLGVDERCLPQDVQPFEQVTDLEHHHDGGNLLISISPQWDRSRAPQGKRAITVSTHVAAESWLHYDQNTYQREKAAMTKRLLDQVERALPGIRQGIEVQLAGTPRTWQAFTLRRGVGGFPQTVQHANFAAPSHRSDLAGLLLAGDTVFPGQGTLGATISGFNAARSAARYLAHHTHRLSQPTKEAIL